MRQHLTITAVFIFSLLLMPSAAFCDPPPGYYDSVDTTNPQTIRQTLHEVIDDHQRFPYSSGSTDTWNILEAADEDPNDSGKILDVYKNESYTKFGGGNGPYNREHSWPRSLGFPDDGYQNYPFTDCHHLFLCNVAYNSDRGSRAFDYCASGYERTTLANNGQGGGSGVYPGNSNWRSSSDGAYGSWETWIGRRGDIARAQFYMDVRYEGGTHGGTGVSEPDLILTDDRALIAASSTGDNLSVAYMGLISVLYQWHLEDPVDDVERARNDVVYSYQGNRNPFIDHPEWVAIVTAVGVPSATPAMVMLHQNFPNPFNPTTTIVFDVVQPRRVTLAIYTVTGRKVVTLVDAAMSAGQHEVQWDGKDQDGNEMRSGNYFYRLIDGDTTISRKLLLLK
ncbi:MAG: T9SS type A sorting domain-containing protein [bacterium]|nr:T9SS type A sorting domain-containing protein [bacterium]